jgi:hypothetical protein
MTNNMSDAVLEQVKLHARTQGALSILYALEEVYGSGIRETDAWIEYSADMKEENK